MEEGRKTRGRQKIEIKKIENESDRIVTFSKRKAGVFKKATELVTLTGAEVGVLIFSPAGKPFSFGHPSFEAIVNRFMGGEANLLPPINDDQTARLMEAHRAMRVRGLTLQHDELVSQIEQDHKREKLLKQMRTETTTPGWWETPIDEYSNVEELEKLYETFGEARSEILDNFHARNFAGASSSSHPPPLNFGFEHRGQM